MSLTLRTQSSTLWTAEDILGTTTANTVRITNVSLELICLWVPPPCFPSLHLTHKCIYHESYEHLQHHLQKRNECTFELNKIVVARVKSESPKCNNNYACAINSCAINSTAQMKCALQKLAISSFLFTDIQTCTT